MQKLDKANTSSVMLERHKVSYGIHNSVLEPKIALIFTVIFKNKTEIL